MPLCRRSCGGVEIAMKKKKRIIGVAAIIVIALVIIAASGLGLTAPERLKGALSVTFTGGLYQTDKSGYIVSADERYLFMDKMLGDGWVFLGSPGGLYTFEREGHIVEYREEAFGASLLAYELTG